MELVVWRAVINLVMTVPHAHSPVTVDLLWLRESVRIRPRQTIASNAWYPATTTNPATCATFNVLETFRFLRSIAKINVQDYVRTLEKLTDSTGLEKVPDRRVAFGRMARQYSYLKMMKRGGALAVRCWACPDASRNLPSGWDKVPESKAYLYKLMLAFDANFRLKNKLRAGERMDPALTDGLGYFMRSGPYKEHIKTLVDEKDVSAL
ncbi:CxC2 domain-containing protein [Mycena indigotica]|uniref:CxC2 domain-containing protein n=1 Tax=Mycena indigotica TaxID=2126181 RepID=A0A8H6SH24_9AGAR|nr:CxC2 domain-containing protein [Mycena indigotica]KAF7299239.1 CxC2 domain-containing protein [Mycena indigotica]